MGTASWTSCHWILDTANMRWAQHYIQNRGLWSTAMAVCRKDVTFTGPCSHHLSYGNYQLVIIATEYWAQQTLGWAQHYIQNRGIIEHSHGCVQKGCSIYWSLQPSSLLWELPAGDYCHWILGTANTWMGSTLHTEQGLSSISMAVCRQDGTAIDLCHFCTDTAMNFHIHMIQFML